MPVVYNIFNKDLDYKIHRKIIDENRNFIILDLNVHNQRLSLINLYGPNKDNPDFFKIITNYIDEICDTDIIIYGTKYLVDPFRENFPT